MNDMADTPPRLLTPTEFAARYRVDRKTVARWDKEGRLPAGAVIRTPGGHRRFVHPDDWPKDDA